MSELISFVAPFEAPLEARYARTVLDGAPNALELLAWASGGQILYPQGMSYFRTMLSAAAMIALAGSAFADDAEYQAKYDKKIAKKFVAAGGWVLDYDEARKRAKAEDKLIFIYFSRSYSP